MKKLTILFILALITSTVQSQSISEKEITGTWQVINIVDAGNDPIGADDLSAAYFDIYPDHSFQLRLKKKSKDSKEYNNTFTDYTWSYNEDTQTIKLNNDKFPIKVSKSNNKMLFELLGTGIKLEVVMPM